MKNFTAHTDEQLFAAIAEGNIDAFREIFDRFRDRFYSVALKLTKSGSLAEEMVQETFVSLWVSRSKLTVVEKADSYLYRILYNKISSYLKKESNRQQILRTALFNRGTSVNTTQETIDLRDRQRHIDKAVELLTPQQRVVYDLSRRQGLSIDEIARQLSLSSNTVKRHLSAALHTIRIYLKDVAMITALLQAWQYVHHG